MNEESKTFIYNSHAFFINSKASKFCEKAHTPTHMHTYTDTHKSRLAKLSQSILIDSIFEDFLAAWLQI